MAKDDKDKKAPEAPPLWEIYAPNPAYSGVHPSRARFEMGVARTTDPRVAAHHADIGHAVFDVNDPEDEAALKRFKVERAKRPETAAAEPAKR